MILLQSIHLYPVKSLRGIDVTSAEVDELGLVGDRRFLVVEPNTGRFITQRTEPQLALVSTAFTDGLLKLSADCHGEISVPLAPDPKAPLISVSVWSSKGMIGWSKFLDCLAGWFASVLHSIAPFRMRRICCRSPMVRRC